MWIVFQTYRSDGIVCHWEFQAFEYAQDRADVSGQVWHVDGPGYDDAVPVPPARWNIGRGTDVG